METIFTKIKNKEIPSQQIYSDDVCFAILDINPIEKGHTLVISNNCYPFVEDCPSEEFSHIMDVVKKVSANMIKKLHCDATNIFINNGKASGQEIPHLHVHIIPRYINTELAFKPLKKATYIKNEMEDMKKLLELK